MRGRTFGAGRQGRREGGMSASRLLRGREKRWEEAKQNTCVIKKLKLDGKLLCWRVCRGTVGFTEQQLCPPTCGGTAAGGFGAGWQAPGVGRNAGSVASIGRLWRSWREKRKWAAPPERDLGLQGESLGEVPVAQVSDGYPSALRVHLCWDWKKPGRLRYLQGIPLSRGERMNGECSAGPGWTHFSPALPKGQRAAGSRPWREGC